VTAAAGAKDNLHISRPTPSTIKITDSPSGSHTGSGVHIGAGCTRSGDYTAVCHAGGVTLINCDGGTSPGTKDSADLDLLPKDSAVVGCGTKHRH
jgi:hypothetical protein